MAEFESVKIEFRNRIDGLQKLVSNDYKLPPKQLLPQPSTEVPDFSEFVKVSEVQDALRQLTDNFGKKLVETDKKIRD